MKKQAYQKPTIYNSDGTKAQTGTYDIRTDPLTNSTADGILDYINNNLEALNDRADGADNSNTAEAAERKKADEALQANIDAEATARQNYVQGELTNYLPLSGGTLTGVVNGITPPKGDNSKKLATTEFVNAKAGNYLPLSGGTMTGSIKYVDNGKVFG